MIRFAVLAVAIIAVSAFHDARGQQSPDPAFLQRALSALQAQRNAALDQAAIAQAQAAQAADETAKLRAEIETLKKPPEPAKP